MKRYSDSLTLYSDDLSSSSVGSSTFEDPVAQTIVLTPDSSCEDPRFDKLSKVLDSATSRLKPDISRKEAKLRPVLLEACRTYKMNAIELGRALIKYRDLLKPTKKWVAVAQAIAEDIDCDVRTLYRCIDRAEREGARSAEGRSRKEKAGSSAIESTVAPLSKQEMQHRWIRSEFIKLMKLGSVNVDVETSRRAFYCEFLAELEGDFFDASDSFNLSVQARKGILTKDGQRRQAPSENQTLVEALKWALSYQAPISNVLQ
jgi:hypothetical protein